MTDPLSVLGWASDSFGPGMYRIALPMAGLATRGHRAVSTLELTGDHLTGLDVLVGQRITGPNRTQLWQYLASHPEREFAMVFEIDDDLWNLDPASIFYDEFMAPDVQRRLIDNVRCADGVTVSTERLAEVVSRFNDNVVVLPNCIDASLISEGRQVEAELAGIGWAGGGGHESDFLLWGPAIGAFLRRNPRVSFTFVGADYRPTLGGGNVEWVKGNGNLNAYVSSFRFAVGVAPIAPTDFNLSKSDVKVLEYAARGIVPVATNHGPYALALRHGETGFLVDRPDDWARHLRQLTRDDALRAEIAENAREWAATRTMQANCGRWEEAYHRFLAAARGLRAA